MTITPSKRRSSAINSLFKTYGGTSNHAMASLRPVKRGFTMRRQSARKPESRSFRIRFRTVPSSAPTDFAIEPYDGRRFQGSGRAERSLTTDRRIRTSRLSIPPPGIHRQFAEKRFAERTVGSLGSSNSVMRLRELTYGLNGLRD